MLNETLTQILATLPSAPGVYRMLDKNGVIIYIGKALNLKKRVNQYFQKNILDVKTKALLQRIHAIEITLTRTETEALLLENTLIKTHKPKYNISLRDDKTYPYLYLNIEHDFPSLSIYRGKTSSKKGLSFGPYPNTLAVHQTLNILQKCFKLRNCKDSMFASRSRPCLQYQIKRCSAPCTNYITQEAYAKTLAHAIDFLKGKSTIIIAQLSKDMERAIADLDFEEAAIIRDQIQQLRLIQQSQSIVQGGQDADLIAIHDSSLPICIEHVMIRKGCVISNQAYFPTLPTYSFEETGSESQHQAILDAFVRFYYLENIEAIPPSILIYPKLSSSVLASYEQAFKQLSRHACRVHTPYKKIEKEWLDFALNNLELHQNQRATKINKFQTQFQALTQHLEINQSIETIACFDISHTQGQATYASCVVFNLAGPDRSAYRRFIITGLTPGDDYAALQQAISRYYYHLINKGGLLPDLLLIDGGKGQVNAVQDTLEELQIKPAALLGITKGLNRQANLDRIYYAKHAQYLSLAPHDEVLHLLQQLRDEAHRFAITSHRKKRAQQQLDSTLSQIEGIGPKRRKMLLQHFGGFQALCKASYQALCQVPGISPTLAKRLLDHFELLKK